MINVENKAAKIVLEYGLITVSILIMVVGIYFFKFPNNFAFGGVTGFATVFSKIIPWSASDFTTVVNLVLLVIGFLFLGRSFGIRTVYASVLMSLALSFLERVYPMAGPLTDQPVLELIFAILLPGVGAAILFQIQASSGGTDIIAMILKKYTSWNIGTVLLLVDMAAVFLAFFFFGAETGLFSVLGLLAKSLVIDDVIENLNLCKCFSIICDNPEPICNYIIHDLKRSATIYDAQGAFSHHKKTVILATVKRSQARRLRRFVRAQEPTAFILISNSSEIIGKGFLAG
ncbi:MAG TPA: YitT family protein [Candidatus Hungatella pullicola]|nr:YitT family protein [Candidatus Hungatella pullicola]